MERIRKPFQGLTNIVRFNWHYFLLSGLLIASLLSIYLFLGGQYTYYLNFFVFLIVALAFTPLIVSFYVYDLSGLYSFNWLEKLKFMPGNKIVNIHAGFDETSEILHERYPSAELLVLDFFNPQKHTEVSIRRARRSYPAFPGTQPVSSTRLPMDNDSADTVFVIFSAHEIRDHKERIHFFNELNRIIKPTGKIVVTEHLRDGLNFLAYNIGFFHFLPRYTWYKTFQNANLKILGELKVTPFITTFMLERNGAAS